MQENHTNKIRQDINKYFDKAKGNSPWSQNPDDYIDREIEVEYEIESENDMDLF